ncbi:MAG: S41 family peptidase [Prochlorothrix sp.]
MFNTSLPRLLILAALSIVVQVGLWLGLPTDPALALTTEQRLFDQAWRVVSQAYLDDTFNHQNWWAVRQTVLSQPLPDRSRTYDVIREMLASLEDPFTRLLEPAEYSNLQMTTSGALTGVGLQIATDRRNGEVIVIAPIAGSPAERVGLHPGDHIAAIDGQSTLDLSLDEAASLMRGPRGTTVSLTVNRTTGDEPETWEVAVIRDVISLNSVIAELHQEDNLPPVGYIRLLQFNGNSRAEMEDALLTLESQGAEGYILDLRNNPGGLLQAGIDVAKLWLDRGPIVYTVDRQGVQGAYRADRFALTEDPLIVLVNRGSASASEILAGALQENDRAQLVGETTFGKGLIQSLFKLADGSGMAVTVAKYETPLHHDIHQEGIHPNVESIAPPPRSNQWGTLDDRQYQAALKVLRDQLAS